MNITIAAVIFLYGIIFGSFLNVCVYRIPNNKSFVTTRSHCPSCEHKLAWYDLIPLFSFIFLKGKCRYCKEKISVNYPLVELLNGVIWVSLFYYLDLNSFFIVCCFIFSALIVLSFIDIKHKIVPDKINLFIFVMGLYILYLDNANISLHIIGIFIASVPLLIIAVTTNGFGGGDIKLFAAIGFFLGWKLTLVAFILTLIIASIYSIAVLILKKGNKKTRIPLVPFISLSTYLAFFYGNSIISWYISTIYLTS